MGSGPSTQIEAYIEHLERAVSILQPTISEIQNLELCLVSKQGTISKLRAENALRVDFPEKVCTELEESLTMVADLVKWLQSTKSAYEQELALAKALHIGEAGSGAAWMSREVLDKEAIQEGFKDFGASVAATQKLWTELETVTSTPEVTIVALRPKLEDKQNEDWVLM